MTMMQSARPLLFASAIAAGFFFLLLWFRVADVYHAHFFDHGALIVAYQFGRFIYIPYLIWLQYALGAYVLYRAGGKQFRLAGLAHFIASFFAGCSLWHILLLAIGLAGGYHYPVMIVLASAVMLGSVPHMARVLSGFAWPAIRAWSWDERLMGALAVLAALIFVLAKGIYLGGGHDFFNHYFTYYKEVLRSGHLGPSETWYHYYYSKGLGLYFMSMLLLDPFAVHLVTTGLIMVAGLMVFSLLRHDGKGLVLPCFGAMVYFIVYVYAPGRGIFALNGGWGDLEKTHELTAVFVLATLWLSYQFRKTGEQSYLVALHLSNIAAVIVGFAGGLIIGLFYAVLMFASLIKKEFAVARMAFFAGASTGLAMIGVMIINYIATGVPQDQLAKVLWWLVDWKKVVEVGYTLELYLHLRDLLTYNQYEFPLSSSINLVYMEFFRVRTLSMFFIVGLVYVAVTLCARKRKPRWSTEFLPLMYILLIFVGGSSIAAFFFGGLRQSISFFRFSSFNYAPTLLIAMCLWGIASQSSPRWGARFILGWALLLGASTHMAYEQGQKEQLPHWLRATRYHWYNIIDSAYQFNTGQYSLYDAITNQQRAPGRLQWGGVHPAMAEIYQTLPPDTKVWSMYNHSYCMLPVCNMQMAHSQVISKRWYDIALGSIEEGKKMLQEDGTNLFFYSLKINRIASADGKDQLAIFYDGFQPEHIQDMLGILWKNGDEYLLTWKENSLAPLDDAFMESWRMYHENQIAHRREVFPVKDIAKMIKDAIAEPDRKHPPLPNWVVRPTDSHL